VCPGREPALSACFFVRVPSAAQAGGDRVTVIKDMPHLKGSLHVHTNYSDGHFSPSRMAEIYRDLGFDFIAVTDHEYLLKPAYKKLFPLKVPGIMVLAGIELEPQFLYYHHVLEIMGDTETLYVLCHPDQYRLPIKEVNRRIEIFREKGPAPLDAVEVTCSGFYTPAYDTPLIALPKVASDDAHDEHSCGKAWIEVECAREKDAIIRAIRAGDAQIGLLSQKRRIVGTES
jgi:hypothetical protein